MRRRIIQGLYIKAALGLCLLATTVGCSDGASVVSDATVSTDCGDGCTRDTACDHDCGDSGMDGTITDGAAETADAGNQTDGASSGTARRLVFENFEDDEYLDTYSHGSYPDAAACVQIVEENGNRFLTGRYDRTDINCRNPHLNIALDPTNRDVVLRYRFRYSSDWNWNGGGAKFWRMAYPEAGCSCEFVHGSPWGWPGFTRNSGSTSDVGYAPLDQIRFPGAPANFGEGADNRGWFAYSVHIRYNDPGSENGIFEMHVDGQRWSADVSKILEQPWNGLVYFTDARCLPRYLELPGNVGGGGQPAPTGAWAIDDIEIWNGVPPAR